VLVEREGVLAELLALADQGFGGHGRLVFLGGEAGVGKSALTRELAGRVAGRAVVRWGGADNLTTAEPLAALVDALPELDVAQQPERLRLFRGVRELLLTCSTLLVLEDLHWADEATLDAVRFLGRRLAGLPVLIVVSFRHDEVTARHPLSLVMGELAAHPGVSRMAVPSLTVQGVAALITAAGAAVDAVALHQRTLGNAFYVTEVLTGGGDAVPATVRDAVLARVSQLSDGGADVAAAAAILGTVVGVDLLAGVAGREVAAVDECLDRGVLVLDSDGVRFRHELAREAVESALSTVQRRRLHQRALQRIGDAEPSDHRTLAHHAIGAGEAEVAVSHAVAAAERAAQLGAHREAAAQYRLALRAAPSGHFGVADRARLFEALSYECYLTDQLPEAVAARQRALEFYELAHDAVRVGDTLRWLSRLSWFLARNDDAERYASRAVATLQPLGDGHELAMAYSNLAQLRMLATDAEAAEAWGQRALALAARIGDTEVEMHALNNVGAALGCTDRALEGRDLLLRSLRLALAADAHEHVGRAYTNLVSCAAVDRRFAEALQHVESGIAYCEERDLDSWTRYLQSWQVVSLTELGRWNEAVAVADVLLGHPDLAPVAAIPATAALARIEALRGGELTARFGPVAALAESSGELQRMAPMACAAAEAAWLQGRVDQIEGLVAAAWALPARANEAWFEADLAWWRRLGGVVEAAPVAAPEPYALMFGGRFAEASALWQQRGCVVWAAYCDGLAPDVALAQLALVRLSDLGAEAGIATLLRTRREWGLELPRRPRAGNRVRIGQLTEREADVLALLAEGLSTSDMADRLVLSPRTVEHHVSAVLRKLGEPTRARAVATARRLGALR